MCFFMESYKVVVSWYSLLQAACVKNLGYNSTLQTPLYNIIEAHF